jgi:hypothetical protein
MLAGEIKEAGHSATTIIHIIDSEGGGHSFEWSDSKELLQVQLLIESPARAFHELTLRLKFQSHVQFVT